MPVPSHPGTPPSSFAGSPYVPTAAHQPSWAASYAEHPYPADGYGAPARTASAPAGPGTPVYDGLVREWRDADRCSPECCPRGTSPVYHLGQARHALM